MAVCSTHTRHSSLVSAGRLYGDRVFQAVLDADELETGGSIHLVDAAYDTGEVISQCRALVLPTDTLETLKTRVQASEKELVVDTLAKIAAGELRLAAIGPNGRQTVDA